MTDVFELEVWSRPGCNLDNDYGKDISKAARLELNVDENVFLGLTNIAAQIDIDNLGIAISENELQTSTFLEFCSNNNLNQSLQDKDSAYKYLEYEYGAAIAWLHIPHSEEGLEIFARLVDWSNKNNFNIQCGNNLYCVNFKNAGITPLWW